ncbi:MAG: hypothetical protein U1E84_01260 [Rhodoferax sp.]
MGIRESIWSLLTRNKDAAPAAVLELVREAMLDVVDRVGDDRHVRLGVRIELARDLTTLWYLRPDLMDMVATMQGETAARESLRNLTHLFGRYQLGGKVSAPHA